jgi:MoxR-like ATPase
MAENEGNAPGPEPIYSRGVARRRRLPGGRRNEITVRFSEEEYQHIRARAADAKVSVHRYIADGATISRPPVNAALIAELTGLRRLTLNIGNNLNQIARCLNSAGRPDSSVDAASEAVRRTTRRLEEVLTWAGAPPRHSATNTPHSEVPEASGP